MELKLGIKHKLSQLIVCSNRTFMELKLGIKHKLSQLIVVLIVPLWNWNSLNVSFIAYLYRSNRTFMELKSFLVSYLMYVEVSSNRTFMELK